MKNLLALLLLCSTAYASPILLDYNEIDNSDGSRTRYIQPASWWQDDSGDIQRTNSSLQPSDGIWAIENTSAPHKVYAATDEVRWRVDPPAGEAAGFEIAFATVSLYMFDEVNGDVEKTIDWARTALDGTEVTTSTVSYPLFASCSLYVVSTPEGYKTNFYVADPSLVPDPQSVEYFGATADLSKVYFSVRYSVSKWPDSVMSVDGVEYGPGAIVDGYSAEFGDDLWMLPTKAYRNVKDFNGQSFHDADDESYVYYVFDRLAQEILVLAPYTLFVGADNVVIDPTTWTSGRTNSDAASYILSSGATSNYGTETYVNVGWNSSTERHGLLKFANMPSVPNVSNVSATMILFYESQSTAASMSTCVAQLLQNWVESEVTFNVYSTGNSWDTAGANNATTDYDGTTKNIFTWASASNIVINDATLATWVEGWIEGTSSNYGVQFFRNGSTTTDYKGFQSDDNATAGLRPYLAITYTSASSLASLSDDAVAVDVFPGSIVASITILDATTASVFIADLIPDVSLDLILEDTTHLVVGAGSDADENWDAYTAVDLIGGGSIFVLVSNYDLTQAAACALYFDSSLTGYTETRSFGLSPAGGGSSETGIADRIDDATALLVTRFDTVDSSLTSLDTLIDNASTALTAEIQNHPSSTAFPIIGYPTTETGTLYVPSGVYLQEDASLEILASFGVEGVTPDLELVVANDANNALVSFNAHDSYHAAGWTFSRTSSANIDGSTEYVFRMRYEIPSSAITASGTGTLRIEGSYFNPQRGTQQIHNTVAMYSRSIDASEASSLTASLATVDTSLSSLDTRMKSIEADAVWTVFTDTEISGATSTYNASPGYCFVPATYPAMYAKVDEVSGVTETLKLVFLHWVNTGTEDAPIYTPGAKFEVSPGTWTVVGDVVTSATVTDIVKGTGQATTILQYNEGGF